MACAVASCAAQRLRADLDPDRPHARSSARRHRPDRDRVHAAWARTPLGRLDLRARLSGGAGLPAVHRRRLCDRESDRRSLLSAVRSKGCADVKIRANTAVGGVLIALLAATATSAVFWTPFDPLRTSLRERLKPPSTLHWLGTDEFGRDLLSRIMAGATTSVIIALVTVVLAVSVGVVVGGVSGYRRGWTDRVIMAFNDALLAFPGILLALGVMIVV